MLQIKLHSQSQYIVVTSIAYQVILSDIDACAQADDAVSAQSVVAPRRLRKHACVSREIFPQQSTVAGSCHGVKGAKLFLYPILKRVRAKQSGMGLCHKGKTSGRWDRTEGDCQCPPTQKHNF